MDLENRVYLVIGATRRPHTLNDLPTAYEKINISVSELDSRMDPDEFLLDRQNPPVLAIFSIPENVTEAFPANTINLLLGTSLSPSNLSYQAD